MCVIYHFTPGAEMDKQSFVNSVHNNWHGYGLILKDGNKRLQVLKDCPEGGNDPEMLWKLVEDNKDIDRFLHLRHATKGAVGTMNTQPFTIFNSNKREVLFMHNGTLNGFGEGWNNPKPEDKSDTLDFADKILRPALLHWHGENGKGDYTNEVFLKLVVEKQWTGGSKGLFVSNDLDPVYYGHGWSILDKSEEGKDKPKIFVSNEQYFKEVVRGPFFEEQERIRKEKERLERMNTGGTSESVVFGRPTGGTDVRNFDMERLSKSVVIIRALGSLFQNAELESLEGCSKLSQVTIEEWDELVTTENSMYVAALLSRISDELLDAKQKIDNQDKDITRMRDRLSKFHIEQKQSAA